MREDDLITALRNIVERGPAAKISVNIGDDAAVWQPSRSHRSVITTDALVENVHFKTGWVSFHNIGVRAMVANVSDVAAMGARPVLATIALGLPEQFLQEQVLQLYRGFTAVADDAKMAVAGGDITRSPVWSIAITAIGEVRSTHVKLRSGARPGDVLACTGPLGASRAGLHVLRHELRIPDKTLEKTVLEAYRTPVARWREGLWLGASANVHAMMDCSDGLSTDVTRMCEQSHVGVEIHDVPQGPGVPDRDFALAGGEDYELLVAIQSRAYTHLADRFKKRFGRPLYRLGVFTSAPARIVRNGAKEKPLELSGFDHFTIT